MRDDHSTQTSVTLLGRLCADPQDQAAWQEFVARYEPNIFLWCLGWHLQESDARDVTQDVLLKRYRSLTTFTYDPSRSFRAWLKTLTRHVWRDLVEDRNRVGRGGGSGDSEIQEFFESIVAGDDLATRLEEEFRRELMDHAMARVRSRVEPRTWDAFRLTAIDGCSGAEVAARARHERRARLCRQERDYRKNSPGDPQAGGD